MQRHGGWRLPAAAACCPPFVPERNKTKMSLIGIFRKDKMSFFGYCFGTFDSNARPRRFQTSPMPRRAAGGSGYEVAEHWALGSGRRTRRATGDAASGSLRAGGDFNIFCPLWPAILGRAARPRRIAAWAPGPSRSGHPRHAAIECRAMHGGSLPTESHDMIDGRSKNREFFFY